MIPATQRDSRASTPGLMKASARAVVFSTALLLPSLYVVLKGAGDEPYVRLRAADALVQIGAASALLALWIVLVVAITRQLWRKELARRWTGLLVLSALVLFLLAHAPIDYLADLEHWGALVAGQGAR